MFKDTLTANFSIHMALVLVGRMAFPPSVVHMASVALVVHIPSVAFVVHRACPFVAFEVAFPMDLVLDRNHILEAVGR